ncbi:hypothetical protein [Desulforegula conservatrix]|uniref:hypothetical protein n=1 Tax=Desulforegula conservatrix TaxID=153026 RepID=UPI00048659D6|nr:hypothetical protein [Desulforegula conservatrix]
MKIRLCFALFALFVFNSCAVSPEASSLISSPGVIALPALVPDSKVTVTTEHGTIVITAGHNNERSFSLDDDERAFVLTKNKGSNPKADLGVYIPVRGKSAKGHDRLVRVYVEEALLSYHTLNEPIDFLWKQRFEKPGYDVETLYTDSGLVVQLSKYIKRDKPEPPLHINIWQVYVLGEKPLKMPGSQNEKIKVEGPEPVVGTIVEKK